MKQVGLILALCLLFVCILLGCIGCDNQNDLKVAYQQGYEEGLQQGHDEGYDEGYDQFYNESEDSIYNNGYAEGYESGYKDGCIEGESSGYQRGSEAGSIEGYDAGYKDGFSQAPTDTAYSDGYSAGWSDGVADQESSLNMYDKGYETGYSDGYAAGKTVQDTEILDEPNALEDLAYIKAYLFGSYSDDADDSSEGLNLDIGFYNSNSAFISFTDVPLTIDMILRHIPEDGGQVIYRKTISYDSASCVLRLSIKIPFKDMMNFNQYADKIWIIQTEVTVTTPNQAKFSDTSRDIALYTK